MNKKVMAAKAFDAMYQRRRKAFDSLGTEPENNQDVVSQFIDAMNTRLSIRKVVADSSEQLWEKYAEQQGLGSLEDYKERYTTDAEETDAYKYNSPNRPIWMGFHNVIKQPYVLIDERTFTTEKPVPDDEVAKIIAPAIKKNNVPVPENIITPSLKDELIKRGVNVVPAQKIDRTKKSKDYWQVFDSYLEKRKMKDIMNYQGLDITIENPVGSIRKWKNTTEEGGVKMQVPYGYINGVIGADGDELDCFVGDNKYAKSVYVVRQMSEKGYDEEKIMLGFDDIDQAKAAYELHINKNDTFGDITEVPFRLFKDTLEFKQ